MSYKSTSYATGLVYNGFEVIESFFESTKPRTKEQMIAKIKRIQAAAIRTDANYDFEVAILTDQGWRSDKIFSATEEPKIFDPASYNYEDASEFTCDYQSFVMYNLSKPETTGKYSGNKKNDCLYVAIRHILEDKMPQGFRSPKTFKKRIGVERLDGVDISKMGLVEDLMQININVIGEHIYTSANKYNKNVNLTLIKGHYSFNGKTLVRSSSKNKKPVVFYRITGTTIYFVSHKEEWNEEFVGFTEITKKYEEYFLAHSKSSKCKATKQSIPLKQEYDDFVKAREELLIASNGFIDLFEKPMMKSVALHILHHQARHLAKPEKIEALEASWIENAFMGGLMYSKPNTEFDNAVCIDQNSQYAANLSSKNFMLPIKAGIFSTMTNEEIPSFAPYGIFRCVITNPNDYVLNRLFRFNSLNYYTHYDISNAIRLKFKVDLIQDGQANALLYDSSSRIKGDHTFGKIVEYLFDLKSKVKYTKRIISALWGSLCEKNKYNMSASVEKMETIPDNCKLKCLYKTKVGIQASYIKNNNLYKSDFARVGPFLTSYCRTKISETITKNFKVENVVRIHTDGFIVINEPIPQALLSTELGKFKIENEGRCIIHNTNKIDWHGK